MTDELIERTRGRTGAGSAPLVTARDRLSTILRAPGPFTSVFMQLWPELDDSQVELARRWQTLRQDLAEQNSPTAALEAIESRLRISTPADMAGVGIIAAADGNTIVDHALEPPRRDFGVVDTLPYAAPFLEWDQLRIPHLVVTTRPDATVMLTVGPTSSDQLIGISGPTTVVAEQVASHARDVDAQLVMVAGSSVPARELAWALPELVPAKCRVVVEEDDPTPDQLAEEVVRRVMDAAARATVGYLRELRYLASHDAAVQGMQACIGALEEGRGDVLLIHDDPEDERRAWLGSDPGRISNRETEDHPVQVRFVDGAIRCAIARDMKIHIVPSTGERGPDDDVAVLVRDPSAPAPDDGEPLDLG